MITTDTWLKIVCSMMINAVLFGTGVVIVLSLPALTLQEKALIPTVVVLSFVLAPLLSMLIAPRMRIRNWGAQEWRRGDAISG